MELTTKFDLRQKVNITDLNWPGYVVSIWVTAKGTEYQVRYFNNGKLEVEYFFEEELSNI
jgi:hypothetical protein